MVKPRNLTIFTILSLLLIGSLSITLLQTVKADDVSAQLATKWSGQATFTTEKIHTSNQSAKLVIPSNSPPGSSAIVYYPYQKALSTIETFQIYTSYTTAAPRFLLYLDLNHDGTTDLILLSDYQMVSNGQWKPATGGLRWGWTESDVKLLDYGKTWKTLEQWQTIYADATVLNVGICLEYWGVDPDGFDQPLYVDELILNGVTYTIIPGSTPEPTPSPTAAPSPQPTPTPTPTPNSTKPMPILNLNCSSSAADLSFKVNIDGSLTDNNTAPLADEPILVSYSLTGGRSWTELTFLNTEEDGTFSAVWLPQATGNFLVRATFPGNDAYSEATSIVSIAVAESDQPTSVFTIYSNSTLSELAFDSANRELSFSVSGETGTAGYVDAYIPASLVGNSVSLNVNLDDKQILYTAELKDGCWVISFDYHHSTHNVAMTLNSTPTSPQNNSSQPDWMLTAGIAAIATIAAVTATALLMKRKNP